MAFSGFNGPMPAGVQRQFKEIFKTWKGYGWEWFSVRPSPRVAAKSGRRRSRAYPSQNLRRSESLGLSRARRSGRPRGPHLIRTPASPSNASTPTMRSTTATGSSATSRATSPQSCRTHSDGPSRQLPASSPDEPGRPLDRPPTSHSEPASRMSFRRVRLRRRSGTTTRNAPKCWRGLRRDASDRKRCEGYGRGPGGSTTL
jgi:hypothetical protein